MCVGLVNAVRIALNLKYMLIIFTGNGQGKTSAALGIALRSLGWDKGILIIQFIKGNKEVGEWKYINQETKKPRNQETKIDIIQFFDDKKYSITEKEIVDIRSKEYKESCEKAWNFMKKAIETKKYDLIILDEIINVIHYKLIDEEKVIRFLKKYSNSEFDIVLTGRSASKKLIDVADTVTELREIKHIFKKGISAKKGIN